MPWSLYQLPTRYLVEQGFFTSHDLALVAAGPGRDVWARAGVDVGVHAREVAAAFEALYAASTESILADVALATARWRGRLATDLAHRWRVWLAGVVRDAATTGDAPELLVDLRGTPRLAGLTVRMQTLVADVARERERLARHVGHPTLLDEGATRLAAMVAAAVGVKEATTRRRRATKAELAARERFAEVFQRLEQHAERVEVLTGVAPPGVSLDVLRTERGRRTEAAARRATVAKVADDAASDEDVDA